LCEIRKECKWHLYDALRGSWGGEAMKNSGVFEWYKRFREGSEKVEDDKRSDRARSHRTDENIEKLWNPMHRDRHLIS